MPLYGSESTLSHITFSVDCLPDRLLALGLAAGEKVIGLGDPLRAIPTFQEVQVAMVTDRLLYQHLYL